MPRAHRYGLWSSIDSQKGSQDRASENAACMHPPTHTDTHDHEAPGPSCCITLVCFLFPRASSTTSTLSLRKPKNRRKKRTGPVPVRGDGLGAAVRPAVRLAAAPGRQAAGLREQQHLRAALGPGGPGPRLQPVQLARLRAPEPLLSPERRRQPAARPAGPRGDDLRAEHRHSLAKWCKSRAAVMPGAVVAPCSHAAHRPPPAHARAVCLSSPYHHPRSLLTVYSARIYTCTPYPLGRPRIVSCAENNSRIFYIF